MIICLQQGADLHTAQLMPLPLTASCFSNIQMSLPFWYRLTWVVPDKGLLNGCMYWQQCMVNKHEHICRSLLRQSSNAHRDSVSEHRHKRRLAPSPDREQFVCLYLAVYASRSVCQCLAVFFYCLVLCIYCLCPSYRQHQYYVFSDCLSVCVYISTCIQAEAFSDWLAVNFQFILFLFFVFISFVHFIKFFNVLFSFYLL